MFKRVGLVSMTVFTLCAFSAGVASLGLAQQKATARSNAGASKQEVDAVVLEAETQMRQHLTEYTERVNQIEFSNLNPAHGYKGVHDTILNAYNGHFKAMYRIRGDAAAKIAKMRPSNDVKSNALKTLQTSLDGNLRTLRSRYNDAMRKLNEAEKRHPAKKQA